MCADGAGLDPAALAADVLAALRQRGDPARVASTRRAIPTAAEVLGVRTPELRAVVRDTGRALRAASAEEVLALAHALIDAGTLEGRQAAYEIVEGHRPASEALDRAALQRLGRGMDCWAAVDGFAVLLAGVAWREGRLRDGDVEAWLASDDRWWRRAAIVSTVPLNLPARGGTGDPARTLAICTPVVDERDDMIVKAVSWSLRTLVKQDPDAVRAFLDEHGERLAPRVRREVTAKLQTGLKNP